MSLLRSLWCRFKMSRPSRRAVVAGSFYPSDKNVLIRNIEDLFKSELGPGRIPKPVSDGPRKIFGLISPHAGYMYSGAIASHGYYHLALDGFPKVVVIIGPNHTGMGSAISVSPGGRWSLPLGEVDVDEDLARELNDIEPYIALDMEAHLYEHSLEVQIPFLQYIYNVVGKSFTILPIVMMHQTWGGVETLGSALVKLLEGVSREDYVIIASTDFTHYESSTSASKKDGLVIDQILGMDAYGVVDAVYKNDVSMCGYGPVSTLLYVASSLGAVKSVLLKYGNSGDVTGDYSSVVAYASFKIVWEE